MVGKNGTDVLPPHKDLHKSYDKLEKTINHITTKNEKYIFLKNFSKY